MENSLQENEMSFSIEFNKEQSVGPTPKNLQILNQKLNLSSSQKENFLTTDNVLKAQQYKDEIINNSNKNKEQIKLHQNLQYNCLNKVNKKKLNSIEYLEIKNKKEEEDGKDEMAKILSNIDFEPLYISIMELVLHRNPGDLDSQIIINDKDNINSNHVLQVLMTFYHNCNNQLRPLIIQNLQLIVKWNTQNSNTILKYTEFYYWLLDILFDEQVFYMKLNLTKNIILFEKINLFSSKDRDAVSAILWDSGMKIHAILMKTALLQDLEGYKKLQGIFIWLESKVSQIVIKEQKYTFSVTSKYILRSLWSSILDVLNEELQGNHIQQLNYQVFWNNMTYFLYYTQEIVISSYNYEINFPKVSDHSKIYLSMRNFCTLINETIDNNIPLNFVEKVKNNNWIDRGIISGLLNVFDHLWSETKFELSFQNISNNKSQNNGNIFEESESITIQRQIVNMLSFSKQEEFLKDFDILMSCPFPERGSFMKIMNLIMTLFIDDIIRKRESNQVLKEAFEKFERMVKYYIVICENTREKKVLTQKEAIHANILYCLNYIYILYENVIADAANEKENSKEKKEIEKIKFCIGKTIKNIFVFILLCVEHIHQQYGHFDNYPEMKQNMASFSVSPMIPNLNMILFDLFHSYLQTSNSNNNQNLYGQQNKNDCILNMKILRDHKNELFLNFGEIIFSSEWILCFIENPKMWEVINKYYNDAFKNTQKSIRETNEENVKGSIHSFKMNQMNKEAINQSYSNQIFDNISKILENEEQKIYREILIVEENTRSSNNKWKKIWKRLRIYDGLWRPQCISNQFDFPFEEEKFSFEKREKNPFFYLKIDKYEVRNRMKPFLKLKLIDPIYATDYQYKLKQLHINQGQNFRLASNIKLINQNIDNSPITQFQKSNEANIITSESFESLQTDINQSSNQLFSQKLNSNNGQSQQLVLNSSHSQSSSNNGYFFNFGKNISKNIAKTIKYILPFQKETSQSPKSKHFHIKNKKFLYTFDEVQKGVEDINKNLLIRQVVQFTKKCQWIKTLTARNGQVSMTDDNLVFQFESIEQKESHIAMTPHKIPDDRRLLKEWPLKQIKEVQTRRYILKRTAVEIFFLDGSCVLLNFPHNTQDCEEVCQKLIRNRKKRCPNIVYHNTIDPRKLIEKTNITHKWSNRQISNFEYLMHLNGLASRSYKDLTQYPVFPWVITDYQSKDNFTTLRDLSKSMGALGSKERQEFYIERFQSIDLFQDIPSFHYGSHYSSPAIIFYFLLRIQPFTNGTKILQGNKFDIADRLFYSLQDTFRCATEDNSDIRELIPELFYLPELFLNLNHEDFGFRQTGERVNNVDIPLWAERNPYKFIVLHRKELESEAVSLHINNWIDLIYGYKQTGKEAEKNLNVFYHLTYEQKIDLNQIKDESTRISIETQIINFGQTPYQLFLDKPHPQRIAKEALFQGRVISDSQAEIKVFRPSNGKKKKQVSKDYKILNFFQDMIDESIISLKWINDTRFVCLRRNGQITQYRWHNNPFHQTQQAVIPFQCGEDKKKKITIDKIKKSGLVQMDYSVNYLEYPCYFLKELKVIILGGMWDGLLKIVNIDTNQEFESYQVHNETITYITADNKENFLITGSKSGEVIVWKINQKIKLSVRFVINDHRDRITQIKISKNMLMFATSSQDSSINLYNLINGKFYRTFFHPKNLPIDNVIIGYQPLPCIVFFSYQDKTLYSYSINGQFLAKQVEEFQQITSSLIMRDNNFSEIIIYGNERGDVFFRELPFINLMKVYNVSVGSPVLSIIPSKDKRFLLCGCSDGYISVLSDPVTTNVQLIKTTQQNNEQQQKH